MNKNVHPNSKSQFRPFGRGKQFAVRDSRQLELTQQLHYHNYYQIYFVTQGCLTHYINNVSLKVMRGDCFIVPPFSSHKIELDHETSSFISFSFFEDFLPDYIRELEETRELFSVLNSSSLLVRVVLQPHELIIVEQAMTLARDEFDRADIGYKGILRGQLASIVVAISRAYKYTRRVKHDALLLPCLEYINKHYASPLTAQEVANQMHLSESTLYRYFKQIIGHSFKDYLTMIRIRNACSLLQDESLSVSQVACLCGYSNYSVFYRAFLQEMQVTPATYRKLTLSDPMFTNAEEASFSEEHNRKE